MKTLNIITQLIALLLLLTPQMQAQKSDKQQSAHEVVVVNYSNENMELYVKQQASVKSQLRTFIRENIKFPEDMLDHKVDGILTLEIYISPFGEIEQMNVFRKLTKDVDKAVLEALSKMKKLDLYGKKYVADRPLYLPISFTYN